MESVESRAEDCIGWGLILSLIVIRIMHWLRTRRAGLYIGRCLTFRNPGGVRLFGGGDQSNKPKDFNEYENLRGSGPVLSF